MRVLEGLVSRVLPCLKNPKIEFVINNKFSIDGYRVVFADSGLKITANNSISAANGLYRYLQEICHVNLSWNGNRKILIDELMPFNGEIKGEINQKYRVYMNYCTLNYTAAWWDFTRWEKEIDFMALNGINMPLAVIGTEAVWYETLLEFGYTDAEALKTISGPAFWAWQLMTNIEGYLPPKDKKYVYERLELGKKILNRMIEYGMQPIQQGFSGHVPLSLIDKYPNARIMKKRGWCSFGATAQLDPLDGLFKKFGLAYLKKQEELLGNYGFYAADPFHENAPPDKSGKYLKGVGRAIFDMINEYDPDSVWVMQAWSIRMKIANAVPKGRLLILDLDSQKYKKFRYFKGHEFVLGTLHNFGGKNALQGRPHDYAVNLFNKVAKRHRNAVGAGLFMEGIEQNPYIYDLLFAMLTNSGDINLDVYTDDYILRRYGRKSDNIGKVYNILLNTCYSKGKRDDSAIGTMLAARPDYLPEKASPCDFVKPYYDKNALKQAVKLMVAEYDELKGSDGYCYDLVDITRQALSDEFYLGQVEFNKASNDAEIMRVIATRQLGILEDLDDLLECRSEFCLDRWLYDAQHLATDENERKWFNLNARAQITLWGDIDGDDVLFDYAWKEWHGLISGYYRPRWEAFYNEAIKSCLAGERVKTTSLKTFFGRPKWKSTPFYAELADFERKWVDSYIEVRERPIDFNPLEKVRKIITKYWS